MPRPPMPAERRELILALYLSGLSVLDVALTVSATTQSVRKVVNAAGVTRPAQGKNRHNKDQAAAARAMMEAKA